MHKREMNLVRDVLLPIWRKCIFLKSDLIKGFGFFHASCLSFLAEYFFIVLIFKCLTFLVGMKVRNTLAAKH